MKKYFLQHFPTKIYWQIGITSSTICWLKIGKILTLVNIYERRFNYFHAIFSELFMSDFRLFQTLIALSSMDTQLPVNFPLISKLKSEAVSLGHYEAFLESAPQFVLQVSIVLWTGYASKLFILSYAYIHIEGH